jgi:hypothetical protein
VRAARRARHGLSRAEMRVDCRADLLKLRRRPADNRW